MFGNGPIESSSGKRFDSVNSLVAKRFSTFDLFKTIIFVFASSSSFQLKLV